MSKPDAGWIKARRSMGTNACVELAAAGDEIMLRNSREPEVLLHYRKAEIAAFFDGVKKGEFDHLLDPEME
ncbi:DUF397 domain-containing protein [Pseudonocardia nigra]|uniref:DUF397 domain-containing protein n=1 Tax=Pseudonocardia nigra TaxID=1921578 RepID=UPI001C5D23A6|nr:DUF397 domain-containing protein [Pseudonocardia nigra]